VVFVTGRLLRVALDVAALSGPGCLISRVINGPISTREEAQEHRAGEAEIEAEQRPLSTRPVGGGASRPTSNQLCSKTPSETPRLVLVTITNLDILYTRCSSDINIPADGFGVNNNCEKIEVSHSGSVMYGVWSFVV